MNVTDHFALSEFACKDHLRTRYPADRIDTHLRPLCETLEVIRTVCAQPLRIVSGYRTPEHNRFVGGAPDSRHVHGDAGDIIARDLTAAELHEIIMALYLAKKLPKLGGMGRYKAWVHVDTRPRKASGAITTWSGAGVE